MNESMMYLLLEMDDFPVIVMLVYQIWYQQNMKHIIPKENHKVSFCPINEFPLADINPNTRCNKKTHPDPTSQSLPLQLDDCQVGHVTGIRELFVCNSVLIQEAWGLGNCGTTSRGEGRLLWHVVDVEK